MQQTQKYKLNLIEPSDPFLPEGLNQNTRKVEEVLSENLGSMQSAVDALTKNLGTHGHNARMRFGTYTGTGKYEPLVLTFDFYPVFFVHSSIHKITFCACRTDDMQIQTGTAGIEVYMTWTDNSISLITNSTSNLDYINGTGTHYFMVLGYDPEE